MAKKNLTGGLDALLNKSSNENKTPVVEEETTFLHVKMDKELKKRAEIYCVNNDLTLKEFIKNIVTEFLDKNKE
jgi:ATP-dependent Clp protease adapter protein ClpS